jgi:hypothetical protein
MPAESAGADRQKRLYLALGFVLFVPTAAVFAWNDWVAGITSSRRRGPW